MSESLNLKGYIVTVDIEKAFVSLSHSFLLVCLGIDSFDLSGIGVLKSVKMAVCGMKCIDLCNGTIKITGIHILYNKKKQNEKKFINSITKIQNVLKVW